MHTTLYGHTIPKIIVNLETVDPLLKSLPEPPRGPKILLKLIKQKLL